MKDSREQFEAWASKLCHSIDRMKSGEYASNTVCILWKAWQASRACIEVELPVPEYHGARGCYEMDELREVLEAQGIKVKA